MRPESGLYGDGPELTAYARRVQADAGEVFSTVSRRHVGLSLYPLAWVSHHADLAATIFVDLARFPKRQVISLDESLGKLAGYQDAAEFDFLQSRFRREDLQGRKAATV